MQIDKNFLNVDFDSIPLDTYWNVGDERECKMHRIHSYPAKFPAFITTKAIQYAQSIGVNINVVADIFCGCGTVAYETTRNGKSFWGCDINPVATLIAKAKSQKYEEHLIINFHNKILNEFSLLIIDDQEIEDINPRIKYWFRSEQIIDLITLKKAIYSVLTDNPIYLNFFLCAFSNILKATSVWLTKSIKPQVDPNKIPANVVTCFNKQVLMMQKASQESQINSGTKIEIETTNFLNKNIKYPFADLVVTSPPYVTSYEYADLHQLSTLWLDFTDDYKSLRQGTIGSLFHESDFVNDTKQLNTIGSQMVNDLYNVDKSKAKAAAKYFVDMQKAISKTFSLLNEKGIALFVIGNTEYKNIKIDNAKHLVESMTSAGFSQIEVNRRKISKKILTPYRDQRGKFTTDKSSRKVYSEEFIIIGRKYGN
jgi:DNA modification methylase